MFGLVVPLRDQCRLPELTRPADHACVSADCPPAAGGRVFEVRVLGPVRAIRRGREIALGGPRERAVLALLLLVPGRAVPAGPLAGRAGRARPAPPGPA